MARDPEGFEGAAPEGPLRYLRSLYYDTGLSNNAPALAAALRVAGPDRVVFGTDWPYADLARTGRGPAPGLAGLAPEERSRIESANAAALVPRLAAGGGEPGRIRGGAAFEG